MLWSRAAALCLVAGMGFPPAFADDTTENAELRRRLSALEEQLIQLREELAALRATPVAVPAAVTPQPGDPPAAAPTTEPAQAPAGNQASGPLPVYGATGGAKVFNPDIGMIGNFVAVAGPSLGTESIAPLPFLSLQESELSLQAVVDPFARADFFLAIGEDGIEVEEGFVTFPSLPGGLLVKAGRMRANFGRLNAFHNHTLPWIDRPLVMFNLLGGETDDPDTGIKDAGISIARLIPAGPLFLEGTAEVFRGDSGRLFQSTRRQDFAVLGRLRGYADMTESSNLEAGVSVTRGRNDAGSEFATRLIGTDLTFRWRPLQHSIYRSLAARTELMWSRREETSGPQRAFGGFVSGDYQFARRWMAGARVDWSERARAQELRDTGASAVLTFWPSEFNQIRAQYRRSRFADVGAANEFLFQALFTIGAHGAHAF